MTYINYPTIWRCDGYLDRYSLWGSGKLLIASSDVRDLILNITFIQRGLRLQGTPDEIIQALKRSKSGVIAIGANDKTVFTLIRSDQP